MSLAKETHYFVFGGGNSSLFTHNKYKTKLENAGLMREKNPLFASLIICRNITIAKKAALLFPFKKILIYQPELFVDTTKTKTAYAYKFKPIIVINGFNGRIFFNNFHFLGSYLFDDDNDLGIKRNEFLSMSDFLSREQFNKATPIIFVGMKRDKKEINKNNWENGIDLNLKRQEIAQCALDKGVADVVGKGWGQQSRFDKSGFDAGNPYWWNTKLELLKGYRFNVALENTLWKYYVTEKIWHSIKGGCLPVYWGEGSSIYDTFPQNSFIDASEFKSSNELIDFMAKLSYDLWYERMEKCIKVYNDSLMKMNYSKLDEAVEKIIERVS